MTIETALKRLEDALIEYAREIEYKTNDLRIERIRRARGDNNNG